MTDLATISNEPWIDHANVDGSRAPYVDYAFYAFGTSTARIFAGGPKILDGAIEVVEP